MTAEKNRNRSFFQAFVDFLILFSGISTASNLARTQRQRPRTRGLFLFRNNGDAPTADSAGRK